MSLLRYFLIGLLLFTFSAYAAQAPFILETKSFKDKGSIPEKFTCAAGNISPEFSWKNSPPKTKSFVLTLTGLDTPVGPLYLWGLYNIPANTNNIIEGADVLPEETSIAKNSLNEIKYRGPCPLNEKTHRFVFTLYALDALLDLPDHADIDDVIKQMQTHIIDKATLHATFHH